jgi:membrane protein YdbS with pleckstrin-like domain
VIGDESRPETAGDVLRPLDPRARLAWSVAAGGIAAVVALAALVLAIVLGAPLLAVAAIASLGVLVTAAALWGARLHWAAYGFRVGDEAVEIVHGVVIRTLSVVPYRRIQQIDVRRGPIERRLGLATLVLRTAAATTDATIPGLAESDADALRAVLLTRAGVGDAV